MYPQNWKYLTYCTVIRVEPGYGHSNMYVNFREIWTCGFEMCKQTNRSTDTLIAILGPLTGVK